MDFIERLFQSKIVILLAAGIMMLIISLVMRRGRMEEEQPSAPEKILWAGGILITVAALIYAGSRGCVVDVPEKDQKELRPLSEIQQTSGCSNPKKQLRDYKKKRR